MAVKTFSVNEVLTAADTNTYLANSGLVYIDSVTVTNQPYARLANCFSNTYRDYRIVCDFFSIDLALRSAYLRLFDGTNAVTTNYAGKAIIYDTQNASSSPATYDSATTAYPIGTTGPNTNNPTLATIDVGRPYEAEQTTFAGSFSGHSYGFYYSMGIHGGNHTTKVAYPGIQLIVNTGNITGTMTVYGYRKP